MRSAGGGSIVMVGSLMAEFPLPYQSAYAATKAALRAVTQSLAPGGGTVRYPGVVVQPGYYRSDINRRRERVILPGSAYAEPLADVVRTVDGSHAEAGDPREVAELILRLAADPDPAPVHSIGEHVPGQLLAKRLLSGRRGGTPRRPPLPPSRPCGGRPRDPGERDLMTTNHPAPAAPEDATAPGSSTPTCTK